MHIIYSNDNFVFPMVMSSFIDEPVNTKFELQSVTAFKGIFSKIVIIF